MTTKENPKEAWGVAEIIANMNAKLDKCKTKTQQKQLEN